MGFFSNLGNGILNAVTGGITGLVGGAFGIGEQAVSNAMSQANQKELMKYQYDLNQQFIESQRNYDKPQNQMARLAEAKLNPNLVYGSGSVVGNTSSSGSVGLGRARTTELSQYDQMAQRLQLARAAAEIKNIEKDTEKKQSDIELNDSSAYRNTQQGTVFSQLYRWNDATWELREKTMSLQSDLLKGNVQLVTKQLERVDQEIYNSRQITESTLQTMAQAREYQIKEFELSNQRLGELIRHNKEMESVGFANARALMVSALAQKMNASTNRYDAETRRKTYQLAQQKFDKMSDAELGKLYQETLNSIAYRQNYLFNLGPFYEQKTTNMHSQQSINSMNYLNNSEYSPYNAVKDMLDLIPNDYFKSGSLFGY